MKIGKKCFLLFFVILSCLIQIGYTPQVCFAQAAISDEENSLEQAGAFLIELNAKRLADKLKSEGFKVEIREGKTQDNETVYRVFAGKQDKSSDVTRPSSELEQAGAFLIELNAKRLADKLKSEGFKVEIREGKTQDNETVYRVFANKHVEPSMEVPVTEEPGVTEEVVAEKVETVSQEALSVEDSGQFATLRNFRTEADAEAYAQQLRGEGYSVTVNKPQTADAPYTVFAKRPAEEIGVPEPSPVEQKAVVKEEVSVEEIPAVKKIPLEEPREPVEVAVASTAEELKPAEAAAVHEGEGPVLQQGEPSVQASSQPEEMSFEVPEEAPLGEPSPEVETVENSERDGIKSKDIFGKKGGYIHPFLSVTGYYTDNVFNQPVDEKSDFVTVLTPGIWLGIPGVNQKILSMNSSNIAPGGYRLSRSSENFFRRYQVYLLYAADIELFSKYHSQNFTGHRIEGLFQYNLRGGLTFEFVDQYLISHDIIGTGIRTSDELDKFYTNLANPRLIYNTGKRWWFMVDYANFLVKYNDSRNDFRHRDDNAISAYIFFRLQPKTSAFFQYQYIDINYRNDILSNSDEHNFYGGIAWDITAKSKGAIKAGYGTKDFADDTIENAKNFRLELQINHRFTPKTNVMLNAWRKTDETNISTTDYILAHGIEFGYNQQFTGRLMGNVRLSYIHDHYKGDLTYDGLTQERKDSYYIGTAGLFYRFREWIGAGIGYTWTKRDSNFPAFEYTNNMFFFNFNISGSL